MSYDVTMNTSSEYYGMLTTETLEAETPLTSYTLTDIVIISTLVIVLIIIIVVGNAIVVGLVVINRRLRPVQNLFIASLALSDLFVGLLIMPLSLVNELIGYWCFGQVLCELWLAFDVLLCTASIFNLCLISVDRYLCITRAMSYPGWRTKQRAMWMIAVVWVLAMVVCFPPLAGWKRPQPYKNGKPRCELSSEVGYVVYSTLGSFFVPLVVMLAVYVQIYRAVRHQVRRRLSVRYDPNADVPKHHPRQEEICRIIRRNDVAHPAPLPPSDDDLEELEMNLVTYHPEDEEDEDHRDLQQVNTIKDGIVRPLNIPSNTDEELDKCITEDAVSLIDSNDESKPQTASLVNNDAGNCVHDDTIAKMTSPEHVAHPGSSDNSGTTQDSHTLIAMANSETSSNKDPKECVTVYRLWRWHPRHRHINGIFRNCFKHTRHKGGVPMFHTNPFTHAHKEHKDARKWRIARARERRLTIILGVIMAAFVFCWFPFFSTYLVSSITGLPVPKTVFDVFFWGGYCNSALNPVIYTIFNRDIRLCKTRGP